MVRLILIFLGILFLWTSSVFGQTKYEKEYRISGEQVPTSACCFVKALPFNKKIKWYKEEGLDRTSIEAKTKYLGQRHSIEFTDEGVFEDLEITIKWKSIAANIQQRISSYFVSNFEVYKIEKIQIQFIGDLATIQGVMNNETPNVQPTIHYEIVMNTKVNETYKKMEFLFSDKGLYVQSAEIVLKNTDHLEY